MSKGILERLAEGPVLGDGGYLLELEKRGYVQAGPFTPEVVIEHPDALAQLHREFLRAGVGGPPDDDLLRERRQARDCGAGRQGRRHQPECRWQSPARSRRKGMRSSRGTSRSPGPTTPAIRRAPTMCARCSTGSSRTRLDAGPPDFWIGETFSFIGEALLFVERAKATGLPVWRRCASSGPGALLRGRHARRLGEAVRRRRSGHRRRQLPQRSGAAIPIAIEMVERSPVRSRSRHSPSRYRDHG